MTKPENHRCGIDCGGGAWCIYEASKPVTFGPPTSPAYRFERENYHIPLPDGPNFDQIIKKGADIIGGKWVPEPEPDYSTPFAEKVLAITDAIAELLVTKNQNYGDSALNPVRIFSQASTEEQLLVRLDDKISRIARGNAAGEDVLDDLIGYAILLKIARMEEK